MFNTSNCSMYMYTIQQYKAHDSAYRHRINRRRPNNLHSSIQLRWIIMNKINRWAYRTSANKWRYACSPSSLCQVTECFLLTTLSLAGATKIENERKINMLWCWAEQWGMFIVQWYRVRCGRNISTETKLVIFQLTQRLRPFIPSRIRWPNC